MRESSGRAGLGRFSFGVGGVGRPRKPRLAFKFTPCARAGSVGLAVTCCVEGYGVGAASADPRNRNSLRMFAACVVRFESPQQFAAWFLAS